MILKYINHYQILIYTLLSINQFGWNWLNHFDHLSSFILLFCKLGLSKSNVELLAKNSQQSDPPFLTFEVGNLIKIGWNKEKK